MIAIVIDRDLLAYSNMPNRVEKDRQVLNSFGVGSVGPISMIVERSIPEAKSCCIIPGKVVVIKCRHLSLWNNNDRADLDKLALSELPSSIHSSPLAFRLSDVKIHRGCEEGRGFND